MYRLKQSAYPCSVSLSTLRKIAVLAACALRLNFGLPTPRMGGCVVHSPTTESMAASGSVVDFWRTLQVFHMPTVSHVVVSAGSLTPSEREHWRRMSQTSVTDRADLTTVVRGVHFLLVSCVQKASAKDLIDTATQKSFFWASNARVVPGDCHPGLL